MRPVSLRRLAREPLALTPRRREMAGVYADEIISGFISKHRDPNTGAFSPPKRATPSPPKTWGARAGRGEEKRAEGSFHKTTTPGEPTKPKPKKAGGANGKREGLTAETGGRGGGTGSRGGPPGRQEQMDRSPPRQARPPASRPTTAGQGRASSELPRPARMPPPKS